MEKIYSFNDPNILKHPIYMELASIQASVETQVFYNHKDNYFALIQNY